MSQKKALEYFKLIEPKIRKQFLDNDGEIPSNEMFSSLGIELKYVQLCIDKYIDKWNKQYLTDRLRELEFESPSSNENYDFPSDIKFFQFGVKNINVNSFKYHLSNNHRTYLIHKESGAVYGGNSIKFIKDDFDLITRKGAKNINLSDYIKIEVDNVLLFLDLLEKGKTKLILANEGCHIIWTVPPTNLLYPFVKSTDLDYLINVLEPNKEWICYHPNDDFYILYETIADLVRCESRFICECQSIQREENLKIESVESYRYIFFQIKPIDLKRKLLSGDLSPLSEIKKVYEFKDFFSEEKGSVR